MAIVDNYYYGKVYAYEVDGYGQYMLMDDANVPSLLAMDYLGYEADDRQVVETPAILCSAVQILIIMKAAVQRV